MDQLLQIMLAPLAACLILTGILTYLGLHVVSRGVVFVDLALAQIAALGSTFAFLLGFDPGSTAGYLYSLIFTFLGAVIFSLTRLKDQKVPQEALIGIVFAVSSAAAILIADQAAQGAEHIEQMLTGSILWVSWSQVGATLLICAAIGAFHFAFRRHFLMISIQPEEAIRQGLSIRWWDLLFYVSFGFVITSSVAIAGILLVFCFLIIPSVIGMLFFSGTGARLVLGWVSGTVVSLGGLLLSYQYDFPSGPAIVCTFGLILIIALVTQYILNASRKTSAMAKIGAGIFLIALLFSGLISFHPSGQHEEGDIDGSGSAILQALENIHSLGSLSQNAIVLLNDSLPLLRSGIVDGRFTISSETVERLGQMGQPEAVSVLNLICSVVEDPWIRSSGYRSLIQLGKAEGIHGLIQLLALEAPPFLRAEIRDTLREISGRNFGYEPMSGAEQNEESINQWEVWWHENGNRLSWDPENKSYTSRP